VTRVRRPAAAGTFYAGTADELAADVDRLLALVDRPSWIGDIPAAIVVPHAGYLYSGPVAASAYARLRDAAPDTVAILGPAHFVPLRGFAVPAAAAWDTPLGAVEIDLGLRGAAVRAGAVVDDAPHLPEHSIEVQVPFLQRLVGARLRLLPIAVGWSEAGDVAELVAALLGEGAFVVVSTDLSHYHDLETARRIDRRTADSILARRPDAIGLEDACGVFGLRGAVELARREDLAVELLDLRTSADTAGEPWRVVGYGAFRIG
jgi:AmmeMemoRadiSam system protein B